MSIVLCVWTSITPADLPYALFDDLTNDFVFGDCIFNRVDMADQLV